MARSATDSSAAGQRPNLVVIMSDQHAPRLMGCAGDRHVQTPHLDALAAGGVRFANTYCAAPLCVPSRMSFLSGQHPHDIGVWTNACLLSPYIPTFAHSLAVSGYETVLCGRMHFEGPDQHHGFARRLVGDLTVPACDMSVPLFEGRIPSDAVGQSAPAVRVAGSGRTAYMAYDDDVTRRACAYLRDRDASNDNQPFCLLVGYLLPHNPYICPRELFEQYMDRLAGEPVEQPESDMHPAMQQWRERRGLNDVSAEESRRARAAYYGLVSEMDRQIGEVLAALAETQMADETVVLYVSDHGEMAGAHGLWWKDNFYEQSVGVPMIWTWPGSFADGVSVATLTSLLDVGPTLLELAGAPPLPGARGRSLLPALVPGGASSLPPRPVFAEMAPDIGAPARMIRDGRWKLCHYYGFDVPQLFDIESDPDERHDLGRSEPHEPIRRRLQQQVLQGWDGAQINQRIQGTRATFKLIDSWHKMVSPGESEVWRVPSGQTWLDQPE